MSTNESCINILSQTCMQFLLIHYLIFKNTFIIVLFPLNTQTTTTSYEIPVVEFLKVNELFADLQHLNISPETMKLIKCFTKCSNTGCFIKKVHEVIPFMISIHSLLNNTLVCISFSSKFIVIHMN